MHELKLFKIKFLNQKIILNCMDKKRKKTWQLAMPASLNKENGKKDVWIKVDNTLDEVDNKPFSKIQS